MGPGSAMLPGMFDDLLLANQQYASGFSLQGIPGRAAKGFALVTCMDSRIEPLTMLGLHPGDAKIVRNAGARVTTDALRSLILATAYLGVTEIAVMQHTDCALAYRDDEQLAAGLPGGPDAAIGWDLLGMPDPDAALRIDVETVRSCALVPPGVRVEGWRYQVDNGVILRVIPS
jgi:carbonic anhydrase